MPTAPINLYLFQFSYQYGNTIYLPYSAGILWSYARTDTFINAAYCLRDIVFERKDPADIVRELSSPGVAAFSTYVWNWEMSVKVARLIKESYPSCLIVFGGPQVPNRVDDLFSRYPFIDVAVHGEGEVTFADLLRQHAGDRDYGNIPGATYHRGKGAYVPSSRRERLADLSGIPSPYLSGVFDDLLERPFQYNAVWETNRGCPYACTFCDWGAAIAQKLKLFPIDQLFEEIEFFGKRRVGHIYGADANFGILPRDVDLAHHISAVQRQFGYPSKFRVNYAKNSTDRVVEIARTLNANDLDRGITLSVQSMDDMTLKTIKRKNMNVGSISSFMRQYARENISTYTEIILGLPGETYGSFLDGINTLLDAGAHDSLYVYCGTVLPNAELNDPSYRATHGIRTIRSPVFLAHSRPGEDPVPEYEELIVATRTMPTDDWKRAFLFAWSIQALHAFNLTRVAAAYFRFTHGLAYAEFYSELLSYARQHPETVLGREVAHTEDLVDGVLAGRGFGTILRDFGEITWPPEEASYLRICTELDRFYAEMNGYFDAIGRKYGLRSDRPLLDQLLEYQRAIVVKYDHDGSRTVDLDYAFHAFDRDILLEDAPSLRRAKVQLQIEDTWRFAGDRDRYAREIVFWGRRNGKSSYATVREFVEAEQLDPGSSVRV